MTDKPKPTPGPWQIGPRMDGDNTIKVGVPINGYDAVLQAVAYVAPRPHYENGTQGANARLIAQAPRGYELAQLVSLWASPDASGSELDRIGSRMATLAREIVRAVEEG